MNEHVQRQHEAERALIFALQLPGMSDREVSRSLAELERLAETAGLQLGPQVVQKRQAADPGTWIGRGKVLEIADLARLHDCQVLLADAELSGSCQRRIADLAELKTIDRSLLILDIFAQHAVSRQGQLEVRLAQLEDRLSRLHASPGALSRLGGGIGTRGPGESRLESDRRHIRLRMQQMKRQLEALARQESMERSRRGSLQLASVAVLGYTNAGKSTLINRICAAELLACDQLFATLETRARRLNWPGPPILMVDTIGFIQKLPSSLMAAFRSTLEEIREANLLLLAVDAHDEDWQTHLRTILQEVEALEPEQALPKVLLWTKADLPLDPLTKLEQDAEAQRLGLETFRFSVYKEADGERLAALLSRQIAQTLTPLRLNLAYADYQQLLPLFQRAFIEDVKFGEDVAMKCRLHPADLAELWRRIGQSGGR